MKGKPWSPGQLVSCAGSGCRDVYKATDVNSCPTGWKIFSPRNQQDWQTLIDVGVKVPASPNMLVDVYNEKNGSPKSPFSQQANFEVMNSKDNAGARGRWRTSDGSAWFLRSGVFSQPDNSFTADYMLYLTAQPTSAADVEFDDYWDNSHSNSYLCQPKAA